MKASPGDRVELRAASEDGASRDHRGSSTPPIPMIFAAEKKGTAGGRKRRWECAAGG